MISSTAFALETSLKKLSSYPECITKGAKIGGNKGVRFKKPFLKFFTENLLN
jgi:hypothetical protein